MNKYRGSNFDDFLQEEGMLEEVSAHAQKRLEALQVEDMPTDPSNRFLRWLQQSANRLSMLIATLSRWSRGWRPRV